MCLFFEEKGYQILIKPNFGFLNNWRTYQLIKGTDSVSLYFKKISHSNIKLWLYDRQPKIINVNAKKLNYNYFNNDESTYYVPIPLVDTFYKYDYLWQEKKEIKENRSLKLFFAGNFNKKHDDKFLTQNFNCPTRLETYKFLQSHFNLKISKEKSFEDLLKSEKDILIFDRNSRNVPPRELVKFLNNSKFFLAFPGVVMPLCHNIIEAMALGCIPILNYQNLFSPKLVDGVNCLTYSSLSDLKDVINKLDSIDEIKEAKMRENVLKYYQEYLSIDAVVNNLISTNMKKISLCAEHQSVDLIKV